MLRECLLMLYLKGRETVGWRKGGEHDPDRRGVHVERSRRREGRYSSRSDGDSVWLRCFQAHFTHQGQQMCLTSSPPAYGSAHGHAHIALKT